MCLSSQSPVPSSFPKEGFGWKVFASDRKGKLFYWLYPRGYKKNKDGSLKTGVWNKSTGPGFHLFRTREAARKWGCLDRFYKSVVQVKYKNPIATGLQGGKAAFTAKEILIPRDWKKGG